MLPNNDDEAQHFLHNPQEPNTLQIPKKALKKEQQSKSLCESICYILQCIVLLILIVLVIKFALLVTLTPENNKNTLTLINSNNHSDEQINTDPNDDDFWNDENYDILKLEDQDLPLEDQNMLKFLLNPEDPNQLQSLLDDAEELFEELEFEAQPIEQGWQFKNGLKLIVKEDAIEQRVLLIINNGFDDDLQSQSENMRMSMQLFQRELAMCDSELFVKSFESIIVLKSKNETDCLKLLSDSLYTISFNQEDIGSLSQIKYDKIDLLLDVILQAADEPDQLNDAQQLEQYFEQTLQQSLVKIVVESTLSNQEVYMAVSDTKLLDMKFGQEAKQMNLDQLLFNLIKLHNPDEQLTTLIYPIQMNEPLLRFFLFWLRTQLQFTVLESENLTLQFQSEDCYGVAQKIYSFGSFIKRQPEKQMIQLHKDYYNLHVLMHDIEDEQEFQKKQLHHLLDLIQSGVVIIQEGHFIYDPQSKTLSMDQFFESKIVNKQFQKMNYGYQLFDYTQVGSVNEEYVSHLKLPSLSKYIPINYNILQLFTAQELVIPQYNQKEMEIKSGQLKSISTDPSYCEELITPIQIEFSNSKNHPMVESIPIQIGQDLWWQFNQGNKVFMGLQIHCNQIYELSQLKAMFKISQQYLERVFEQHEALYAGFTFTVESNLQGLNMIISGWKGTFNIFRDLVINQLRHMEDQELFKEIQQELVDNFKKYYNEKQQFYLLQYLLPKLMLRPVNDPQEIIQQLTNTKLEDLQKLFNNITYSAFISGNVDPNYIRDSFVDYTPNSQIQLTKTLKLNSNLLSVQQTSQNTLLRFYSGGQRNSQNIRKLLYIQEYFEKNPTPFTIRYKSLGCVDGLVVYATSTSSTPSEMGKQFETIIQSATFNYQAQGFLKNEEYIWDKILYRNYDFNSFFEDTQFVEEDIKNVFEWKSLTIHGYSNKNKIKEKSTYNESSQVEYFECEYAHQ